MAWLYLALAVGAEVTGTVSLKLSDGFTRLVPSLVVVVGYAVAFWSLSRALTRGLGIGVAYGTWSAAGVVLVAVAGAVFLGEHLTRTQAGGLALVVGGVLALELGGEH